MKFIGISGGWRKTNPEIDNKVRKIIREIMTKGDGIVLSGALDEIMVESRGKLIPTDYKSSGDPPKEDKQKYYVLQLHAYGLMLSSLGHEVADFGYLLHYFPKVRDSRSLDMAFISYVDKVDLDLSGFKKTLREMVEVLESDRPEPGDDCKTCQWLRKITY